jgi:uncharacterized membrane protein YbhN (UPF0104 family)
MRKLAEFFWPIIGLVAVVCSFYLLYHEFQGESVGAEVWANLKAISLYDYAMAALCTLVAYFALAWYDRIALIHLGVKHISWVFISMCSFTTYALSHNIGASVFSGAMVRYRAYSSKGLTAAQVAALVLLCSYTFAFGNIFLGGLLLTWDPGMLQRLAGFLPDLFTNPGMARVVGLSCLGFVLVYMAGSLLRMPPFRWGRFEIEYPRPDVMFRQLFAAPLELIGAAGIIYFALPDNGNPGYLVVLGAFLLSFSAALVSHAPGGLGVFELLFIKLMPDVPRLEVLAALLVWRLFYLIIPLLAALVVVALFERRKLIEKMRVIGAETPE